MDCTPEEMTHRYYRLTHRWNAIYESYARSAGLSHSSLTVLSMLYWHPEYTQKQLCEECFLPKQTINAIVTSFYKKGWLRLEEQSTDRRSKIILFTPEGRQAAQNILLPVRQAEKEAMTSLSPQEQDALLSLTEQYVSAASSAVQTRILDFIQ